MRFALRLAPHQLDCGCRLCGGAPRPELFLPLFTLSFAYAKHAFQVPDESRKYCTFRARSAARNRADVMEIVANSPSDRRQVGRQKDPQRCSVTNSSKLPYRELLRVGATVPGHH
jgi:hypothetical protein